jgi:phospholipase A1
MGGIVVRFLLECGAFEGQPWFKRVKTAIFVCTPHLGAPLALFRILGLDGIPVILPPWAMAAIARDPTRYPAAYQLLPAPDIDCVSRAAQTNLDVYDAFPALLQPGVAAVRGLHAQLDKFAKPDGVTYNFAAGVGTAKTVSGIHLDGKSVTEGFGDGDGTVPIWSADPTMQQALAQTAVDDVQRFVEDHVGILSNPRFLAQLDVWLRGTGAGV